MYWYFYFDPNTFGECINTIITVFFFDMLRDYYPRSMYRPSWHDLHDNRGQYICYNTIQWLKKQSLYLFLDILEISKEKLNCSNSHEKLIRKGWKKTASLCNSFILIAFLQRLLCNGFRFSFRLCLWAKLPSFPDYQLYQKISTRHQGPLSQLKCSISSMLCKLF